jgi:hypothetical protein
MDLDYGRRVHENHTERCVYVDILKKCMCKVICERVKMICVHHHKFNTSTYESKCGKCAEVQCLKGRHGHGEEERDSQP